ncbi:hypothetical protein A8L34_28250 [Bacillus sp. FJAT-27264]|uniref:hypothetical protein n=1 Tax=Paenibacillus sp. (strain DSM 101736 / FJAT-27264) TaxID=1850362 RepID=UPI00080803D0|nr:hypothetical protein [Bacillus sp. FJAT-27264]OBZ15941.1 hypothetical protein A8L34_28250 [Bacillus sp. FJAT-27264]
MKFSKKIVMVMVFILLTSMFPEHMPGGKEVNATVSAAEGDDIINYRNITVYPISNSAGDFRGAISYYAPAFTLTNIQFNKTTKKFTFDIPDNPIVTGNIGIPITTNTGERAVRAKLYLGFNLLQRPESPNDTGAWYGARELSWENYVGSVDKYGFEWHEKTEFNLSNPDTESVSPYSAWGEPFVEPKAITFNYNFSTQINLDNYSKWLVNGSPIYPLIPNHPPNLSVTSPNNQLLINATGLSGTTIEGFVNDPDGEDVTVTAEIPNLFYKNTVIPQALLAKPFSIPIDAIDDSLPPGNYTMNITASDPSGMKKTANLTINVKQQMRNKSFILVDTPVEVRTKFFDSEGDPKYSERYRYDHDPNFYDNSMGIIGDSGLWRTTPYLTFPLSGVYTVTFQGRDNPLNDDRFDIYRKWSRDNLSSMTFHVHRKPIALFSAKLVGGTLQITDSSYDLDHISTASKGLVDRQWQYKKTESGVWIDGPPPPNLPSTDQYDIRLRVRDMDGENGLGVWSDWCQRTVGAATNLPPVALFTVDPNIVSYRKATTITDKSFDPDNDPLDIYQWSVIKNGWQELWPYWGGPATPPNIAQFGVGTYQITLKVHDNRGLWSEPYSQIVNVINHPPVAAFNMPPEVYRDTLITMENMTPDPDEDGDNLSYVWYARNNSSPYYWAGNKRNQNMTIRDLIAQNGISQQQAISDGWEMRLTASDGSLSSSATRLFKVLNHVPTAAIIGTESAYQYDSKTYKSGASDLDSSDVSSLQYYWKLTDSDGEITSYRTKDINVNFPTPGIYSLEHWSVDQIGDKSNIASIKINVAPNLPPTMTLTSPTGTVAAPSILDSEKQGDPLIQWTYSDPENDPQEKYRLEFFTKQGLLAKSVENPDSTGFIRQYQIPNGTFERFEYFTVLGRAYSKGSWSEVSNEKSFIIDNPPRPGFTLITNTGKDATKVPIYRTDILSIKSTATDPDELKGDTISYKYFLKPGNGTEGLASSQKDFTKQFTTNGAFTYRQVVTDSLGLFRELSQSITVVNRLPKVNITYPTSDNPNKPTIASTLTPIMKWEYQDDDGDLQQQFRVKIINLATGAIKVQSGDKISNATQWQIPADALIENEKYAVEVQVFDGFDWSAVSARKYFMVNLLSVKGGVKHTDEWNINRMNYNLQQTGDLNLPRGYSIFWAGEKFVLVADATGLPDTITVTMDGGFTTQLTPIDSDKTYWTGSLFDPSFEHLPDGPITFTFVATNEYQTKTDKVTITVLGNWGEYFRLHRTS